MCFFFSLVSPIKQVDVFLWISTLLHNRPAYMQAGFRKPESLQNWLNVWNSASAGKFMGNHWYFWFTAWHESHCFPAHFGTPSSLRLTESRLGFLSLTDQHRPVFSEQLWSMLLHFIYTSRNKGRRVLMWCSDTVYAAHFILLSKSKKMQDFFCYTKGEV